MFKRSLRLFVLASSFVFCTAALAAPAKHKARHETTRHKTSGAALIVRGDQVSTAGLVDAVANAFADTGDGHLDVQPFNTIDGIDRALDGSVDLAASARPAYPKRAQEAGLTFTPVAWDALVLITNEANPVRNLTLRQLHDIYYGKIRNWSEVGGLDQPIDLDGVASPLDGVQFSFRRLIFGNGDYPVAVPRLFINIDSLQQEVSLDGKALALSTLVHARRQKGIKIIPIEGVAPSIATLENASYPLPVTIYLAYKADSPKIATIQKFLAFLGGAKADGILRSHDLLPYAQATVLNAKSEMDRINTLGARMITEGLPPEYAPGNEFARLAGNPQEVARAAALQQAAAKQVAAANAQRAALSQAAGVDPAPAAAPAAAQAVDYTVASGDTLSKIAKKHSVSVDDLRKWNHLRGDMLQVGQVLKVSSSHAGAGSVSCTAAAAC
ncbi:MAG: phosphate ABC transporter, substrate-binding protein PstS [Rhodanobacteraceae bacterium]|jgi:phosphate transport system substrate-binding protein|nr:MAG: phosphate ABC transporter, substrate-binding protein PstS [Rhodanobacteraceae bacterium]